MKKLLFTIAVALFAVAAAEAGKEEVTVTGDVVCAHCDLKIGDSCQEALQTADKKIYLLDGKVAKAFFKEHEKAERVTATGTTKKEGEQIVLDASKIELAGG